MIESMEFPLLIGEMAIPQSREREAPLAVMGDDEFRRFYERTARPLWAYLSRITGSPQQADDVLQEAYYRIYRGGDRHESESHRRNSLFQIATNLVRDAARRGRRYEEVPLEHDETSGMRSMGRALTVAAPDHQATARTDLSRAMEKLEPVQRQLLWLAYAEGSSHEEIAEILGLRAISVRTLLLRARRKLAGILMGDQR